MECVTVKIMSEIMLNRWIDVFQLEWNVLQLKLCGRNCTAAVQWYCSLNRVCYSEHYVKGTAQQVDSSIEFWMVCVTVNIMKNLLHCSWTVLFQL